MSSVFVDVRNSSGLYVQGGGSEPNVQERRSAGNSEVGIEADSDVTRIGDLLKDAGEGAPWENLQRQFCGNLLWVLGREYARQQVWGIIVLSCNAV